MPNQIHRPQVKGKLRPAGSLKKKKKKKNQWKKSQELKYIVRYEFPWLLEKLLNVTNEVW